jgi:hypothetical protein
LEAGAHTLEEGTQTQWLHDVLTAHAERVIVCNTRGHGERSNKNDRVDAKRLSELLRLGALKPVYHGASALLTLKELVRNYVAPVEDGTRAFFDDAAKQKQWQAFLRKTGLEANPNFVRVGATLRRFLVPVLKACRDASGASDNEARLRTYNPSKSNGERVHESHHSMAHRLRRRPRGERLRSDLAPVPELGGRRRRIPHDEAGEDGLGVGEDG